jgi:hypothetical protein
METAGVSPLLRLGRPGFEAHLTAVDAAVEAYGQQPVVRLAKPGWSDVHFNLGAADGAVHIEDIERVAEAAMLEARTKLDGAFATAGIRNAPAVFLSTDPRGRLTVDAHPQREKISQLFHDSPELEESVRSAMFLKENAVSWRKAALFAEVYQNTCRLKGKAAAEALSVVFLLIGNARSSFRYDGSGFTALFNGAEEEAYLSSIRHTLGARAA